MGAGAWRHCRRGWIALAMALGGCQTTSLSYSFTHMGPEAASEMRQRVEAGFPAIVAYLNVRPAGAVTIADMSPDVVKAPTTKTTVRQFRRCFSCPVIREETVGHVVTLPVLDRSMKGSNAIIHELTHAVAGGPHGSPRSGNRFLAEGLAVHVHGVLSPSDDSHSFDNFPIHRHARTMLERVTDTAPITRLFDLNSAFDVEGSGAKVKSVTLAAYVLAGSFVTYLIQRDGPEGEREAIAKYMRVYKDGCMSCAFGKPTSALEEEWKAFLQDGPVARTRPLPLPGRV